MIRVISCKGLPITEESFAEFDEQGGNIGRAEGSTLQLRDTERSISRLHASVLFYEGSFFIRGLGLLPVYLNDNPLPNGKDSKIENRDRIRIGDYLLEVVNVKASDLNNNKNERCQRDQSLNSDYVSDNQLLEKFLAPAEITHSDKFSSIEKVTDKKSQVKSDPFELGDAAAYSGKDYVDSSDPFANVFSELDQLPRLEPTSLEFTDVLSTGFKLEENKIDIDNFIEPKNSLLDSLDSAKDEIDPFEKYVPEENRALPSTDSLNEQNIAIKSTEKNEELIQAFLKGAGVPELFGTVEMTPQLMNLIGQLLRESTQGTRELLRARILTKQEMHVPPTMMQSDNNNPLKFTPNVEMALTYLLTPQKRGFMMPLQALKDSYDDLRSHQFGIMAGMQAALLGVLKRFDPKMLEQRLEKRNVIDSMLSVNRKAKLWDLFCERYSVTHQEAQEDFQVVFGKEFVQAYEGLVAKLEKNFNKE